MIDTSFNLRGRILNAEIKIRYSKASRKFSLMCDGRDGFMRVEYSEGREFDTFHQALEFAVGEINERYVKMEAAYNVRYCKEYGHIMVTNSTEHVCQRCGFIEFKTEYPRN